MATYAYCPMDWAVGAAVVVQHRRARRRGRRLEDRPSEDRRLEGMERPVPRPGPDPLRAAEAAELARLDDQGLLPDHALRSGAVAVEAALPRAGARVRPPGRLPGPAEPQRPVPLARSERHHV